MEPCIYRTTRRGLFLYGDGDFAAGAVGLGEDGGQLDVLHLHLLLGCGLVVACVEDELGDAEDDAEAIGDGDVEVELDESVRGPADAVEQADEGEEQGHVLDALGPDHLGHDAERGGVHGGVGDDAEDADDHGPPLVGVGAEEHAEHEGDHEYGLGGEHAEHPEALPGGRVDEVGDEVDGLDEEADGVDGDDEGAVGVDEGEAVEDP